jgi:hypothetical protein
VLHVDRLAFQGAGCRVIQKCLEHSSVARTQALRQRLLEKMMVLCQCEYGNYIISNIVDQCCPEDLALIQLCILKHALGLSTDKYASNVVERAIRRSDSRFLDELLKQLTLLQAGEPVLNKLARDKYGNYVVKSIFLHSSRDIKAKLRDALKAQTPKLQRSYYGNFVLKLVLGKG